MKRYLFRSTSNLVFFCILMPISIALEIGLAYLMQTIIDYAMHGSANHLLRYLLLSAGYVVLTGAALLAYQWIINRLVMETMIQLKADVLGRLIRKDTEDFSQVHSAQYISILTSEMQIVEDSYYKMILFTVEEILQCVAAAFCMFFVNVFLGLFVIACSLLQIVIPLVLGKPMEKRRNRYSEELEGYTVRVKEILGAFPLIKAFRLGRKMERFHQENNKRMETAKCSSKVINAAVNALSYSVGNVMYIGTFLIGAVLTIRGAMTVGTIVAASQLMVYIASPLTTAASDLSEIRSTRGIVEKLLGILRQETQNPCEKAGVKPVFQRELNAEGLSYTYPQAESPALKDFHYTFQKGGKYMVVGRSGSGKSTLAAVLSRMLSGYDGKVFLDGQEIRSIGEEDFFQLLTVNQQFPFLFDDTLRNNICLYTEYGEEAVQEAVSRAGLTELAARLPQGLDTSIGEGAGQLSGGERQRISIARALIQKTPILIMDESTSGLDNETASEIEKLVMGLVGVTLIFISHRLSEAALGMADGILAMDRGILAESGGYQELMAKKGYLYSLIRVGME